MSSPSVSAVLLAYNAAGTIERALDSVYAQTYTNIIEVIVVDDGSADQTAQIIRERYPSVTLIQQENTGSPTARNRGITAASGEYVAFLDDDDEWFPEKTKVQMECFSACPGLRVTLADAAIPTDKQSPLPTGSEDQALVEPLRFRDVFPLVPFHYGWSGWIVDRTLFEQCGGIALHMRRSADTEWLWRLLSRGYAVARIRQPLYCYYSSFTRRSPESRAGTWSTWCDVLTPIVEEYAARAIEPPTLLSEAQATESLARFYEMVAWHLWEIGERGQARTYLTQAAKLNQARGLPALRRRLAAWAPGVYRALSRLRT